MLKIGLFWVFNVILFEFHMLYVFFFIQCLYLVVKIYRQKWKKYKVEFDNVIAISSKSEESNALCSYIQILTFQSPGRS